MTLRKKRPAEYSLWHWDEHSPWIVRHLRADDTKATFGGVFYEKTWKSYSEALEVSRALNRERRRPRYALLRLGFGRRWLVRRIEYFLRKSKCYDSRVLPDTFTRAMAEHEARELNEALFPEMRQ